jgi:hypothetical protein
MSSKLENFEGNRNNECMLLLIGVYLVCHVTEEISTILNEFGSLIVCCTEKGNRLGHTHFFFVLQAIEND